MLQYFTQKGVTDVALLHDSCNQGVLYSMTHVIRACLGLVRYLVWRLLCLGRCLCNDSNADRNASSVLALEPTEEG
jgi:hypothetical protein